MTVTLKAATVPYEPALPTLALAPEPVDRDTDEVGFDNGVGLSSRESEIVRLIATGRSNEQIGAVLFLSVNTVKSYIRSAYRRMGVSTRAQAVIWAFDHALVTPKHAMGPVA